MRPNFSKMTYERFNLWGVVGIPYLLANAGRFNISSANQALLTSLFNSWGSNWTLWINADTWTRTITNTRRSLRKSLTELLNKIFDDIPESVYTETDGTNLQISLTRNPRTPAPVMDHPPVGTLVVRGQGLYTIRFQEPSTPETRALPKGQMCIFLQGFVGAAGIPHGNIQWQTFFFVTRFDSDLAFTEPFRGQTAYYRYCYVNSRGEISPVSDVMSFVIG